MPQQALYLKWRPHQFEEVVGQDHITRALQGSLATGRVRHAYLFSGPRGTGKTTTARLLAKAVNCTHNDIQRHPCNECPQCLAVNEGRYMDLIEIDAATHTGVDDVRDLRDKIAFTPGEGQYKVYIIDEVHRFTGNAFDALLKTLEEPPDHAIFVLATTEIDKVPATIKSRCLQFEFRRVSLTEVADRLQLIAEAEGLNIARGALEVIARQGTGSVRDSISLLDQIVTDPAEEITLEVAQRILGTADMGAVRELIDAIIMQDETRGLHVINHAVDEGSDPRQFGRQVVEYLRSVMLAQTASADLVEASTEDRETFSQQANQIDRAALLRAIRAFNEAVNDYRGGWQPQLTLELALIEACRQPEPEFVQVMERPMHSQGGHSASVSQPQVEPMPQIDMETGKPPLIPVSEIKDRWNDMMKALYKLNTSAPAVLDYFKPFKVDGNVLYLATDTKLYFDRLHGQQAKLDIVEAAIRMVHKKAMRVQVVLLDEQAQSGSIPQDVLDDPLIQAGLELGGRLKKDEGD